jgi:hypothetical protein
VDGQQPLDPQPPLLDIVEQVSGERMSHRRLDQRQVIGELDENAVMPLSGQIPDSGRDLLDGQARGWGYRRSGFVRSLELADARVSTVCVIRISATVSSSIFLVM